MGSVLADFPAYFVVETFESDDPLEGRVRLHEGELVFEIDDGTQESVPLDRVMDINYDTVPLFVDSLPGTPVTIAFQNGIGPATAVIGSNEQKSKKFRRILFKTVLDGRKVTIKHPSKVGGRVMDTDFTGGILSIDGKRVRFDTDEGPCWIHTDKVINFSRSTRRIDQFDRSVIVVKHAQDGSVMTSLAATQSSRTLSLLGRFIQRRYREVLSSLQDLDLSETETKALTTLYSVSETGVSLRFVLDSDPKRVKQILHSLHRKGLIESEDGQPVLTAKGQIVVNEYLERING